MIDEGIGTCWHNSFRNVVTRVGLDLGPRDKVLGAGPIFSIVYLTLFAHFVCGCAGFLKL